MRIKEIELEIYPIKSTYKLGKLFYLNNEEYRITDIVVLGESRVQFELERNDEFGCYDDPIYHVFKEFTEERAREERRLNEVI